MQQIYNGGEALDATFGMHLTFVANLAFANDA